MTQKLIFSPENYIAERLKTEGAFEHVKQVSTALTPQTALSGAAPGVPVLIVAPLEGRNIAENNSSAIVVEKRVAVVVIVRGVAANGGDDEETVDKVIETLHGYPLDDPELQPVMFESYEAAFDEGRREYTLLFTTRYERCFAR